MTQADRPIRVAVVDDQPLIRAGFSMVLAGQDDIEVVGEAENGAVAVDRHRELNPDLTTMDITMPEMDGLAALREIRAGDPSARVVMCSAMSQQSMVIESIQAGAKDFIVKPFQPDRVLEAVQKALA